MPQHRSVTRLAAASAQGANDAVKDFNRGRVQRSDERRRRRFVVAFGQGVDSSLERIHRVRFWIKSGGVRRRSENSCDSQAGSSAIEPPASTHAEIYAATRSMPQKSTATFDRIVEGFTWSLRKHATNCAAGAAPTVVAVGTQKTGRSLQPAASLAKLASSAEGLDNGRPLQRNRGRSR